MTDAPRPRSDVPSEDQAREWLRAIRFDAMRDGTYRDAERAILAMRERLERAEWLANAADDVLRMLRFNRHFTNLGDTAQATALGNRLERFWEGATFTKAEAAYRDDAPGEPGEGGQDDG